MSAHHHQPSQVPLDPDLFNPDVVGHDSSAPDQSTSTHPSASLLPRADENFYPTEDGWDLDQDELYYDTDEDQYEKGDDDYAPETDRSPSRTARAKKSNIDIGSDLSSGQEEQDEEEDDSSGDDEGSEEEHDSSDLRRLIGAIHARGSSTDDENRGLLGKEWDRSMDQELNEIKEAEKLMKPGKRKKYKPRGEPELSVEVSVLLGNANMCFIEKKYHEAIPLFEEAVRIEPMCRMAWNNLGAIYHDLGDFEKSCQFRMIGAHLTSKSTDTWKELGAESRQHGLLSQAIYCYSEAIKSGKNEVESMWDRSYLLYEIGRPRQALAGYLAILKLNPHNSDVLREVAHLCATTDEKELPIKLFHEALNHYQSVLPTPSDQWLREGFGLEHIRTLVTLLMKSHPPIAPAGQTQTLEEEERLHSHYYDTLNIIKQAIRWLQGRWDRQSEDYLDWDLLEDDREYDLERMTREGWENLADSRYENCPIYPLDNDFRGYLGLCRLKIGDDEEAALHFEIMKTFNAEEHAELFMSIGDAYYEFNQWDEALEFYHDLAENDSTNNPDVWHKIGQCYRNSGNTEGALECFEAVIETDPLNLVAKTQLAELYELMGDRQKAFMVVNDIIEIRRSARESGTAIEKDPVLIGSRGVNPLPSRASNPLAMRAPVARSATERRLEEEMRTQRYITSHERLEVISSKLSTAELAGDLILMTEYVRLANPLIEGFRQTTALFPSALASKFGGLQLNSFRTGTQGENIPKVTTTPDEASQTHTIQEFRGIRFTDWVRIFVYYAFSCCKMHRADEACEVLGHVMAAPVFRQSASMQQVLRLAYAAACFAKEDFVAATDTIRWLSRRLPFHNDPVRLINALLCRGFQPSVAYFNTNTQKWLLRQLQMIDRFTGRSRSLISNNEENENGNSANQDGDPPDSSQGNTFRHRHARNLMDSEAVVERDDDDDDDDDSYWKPSKFKPTKANPVFAITFAQMLAGARSFKSAIINYLRVYETHPDEPLLNLLLAVTYVQRAMQRQTDNRHHQIVQALAFWQHYRDFRAGEFEQEVEYNLARMFHGLGLTTFAVTHYHRVLSLSARDKQAGCGDEKDLSSLAAYNLVLIYSTSGSPDLAYRLTCQYLSI